MKKMSLFLMSALFLTASQMSFAESKKSTSGASLDRIVAVVNNQIITRSELAIEEEGFKKQLDPNSDLSKLKQGELHEKILKQLIDEALELQLAQQRGISVAEKELDAAVTDIAKRNQLSLSKFKDTLQSHGMSYANFRDRIRKQMIIVRLQQSAIGDSAQVTDQDVDNFLKDKKAVATVLQEYHVKQLTKKQARALLYERKLKAQADAWLEKLRESAYIKIMPIS